MKSLAMAVILVIQGRNHALVHIKNIVYDQSPSGVIEGMQMERGTISNPSSQRIYALSAASLLKTHKQILLSSPLVWVQMGMQNWAWEIKTLSYLHPSHQAMVLWEGCCYRNTWVYSKLLHHPRDRTITLLLL